MSILQAIILAIIEGITEYLPVSSTGHLIIGAAAMGIASDPFVKVFAVAIQFGAILSVMVLYWQRFLQDFGFYRKLFIAFLPAVFFGLLLKGLIDRLLENVIVVAIALIVGGIIFLFLDEYFAQRTQRQTTTADITNGKALRIGLFQVIAMIPGVSRSAATIIGGLTQGLSPTTAAEFSFFLAVPTMFAATCKSMWDYAREGSLGFSSQEWLVLGIGNLVAFIVALLAIKGFIRYLTTHGFKVFGYYRILAGLAILFLYFSGWLSGVNTSDF